MSSGDDRFSDDSGDEFSVVGSEGDKDDGAVPKKANKEVLMKASDITIERLSEGKDHDGNINTTEYRISGPAANLVKAIQTKCDAFLEKVSKTFNMAGFRAGKVPYNILYKHFEKDLNAIREDLMNRAIAKMVQIVVIEWQLSISAPPEIKIEEFNRDGNLVLHVVYHLIPEIKMPSFHDREKFEDEINSDPNYAALKDGIVVPVVNHSTTEVNNALLLMAQQAGCEHSFERAESEYVAKFGDAVIVDFSGKLENGSEIEGGSGSGERLVINPIPGAYGFEHKLVNCKEGDKLSIPIRFPDDHPALPGEESIFDVTVHEIHKGIVDAEALAKTFNFDQVTDLKSAVNKELLKQINDLTKVLIKKKIFDILDKIVEMVVPFKMIEIDAKSVFQEKTANNSSLIKTPQDKEILFKECINLSKTRVKLGIIVAEIAKKAGIYVTSEDITDAKNDEIERRGGGKDSIQAVEELFSKQMNVEKIKGAILENKVVDYLLTLIPQNRHEIDVATFNREYLPELEGIIPINIK